MTVINIKKSKVDLNEPETNWVMIRSDRSVISVDCICVSFSEPTKSGSRTAIIKIGLDILQKMGWQIRDKIGVFYDQNEPYHWRLAKVSNGYTLLKDGNGGAVNYQKLQISWKLDGVTFTKNKRVEFKQHKDSITFRITQDQIDS